MGDIAFAVAGRDRHRDALLAERGIAVFGRGEDVQQGLVRDGIVGAQPAVRRAHDIALRHHHIAADIGVNDAPGAVDDEHGRRERIQAVGKRRGFDLMRFDHLADQRASGECGEGSGQSAGEARHRQSLG